MSITNAESMRIMEVDWVQGLSEYGYTTLFH